MESTIFILGLHRSGTTLLYQMLTASRCFNIVTARHVIEFDRLRHGDGNGAASHDRLKSWFDRQGLSHREVDVVNLGPQTPEEYGFILNNLGKGWRITPGNFVTFQHICEVIRRDGREGRPLLLKNPWDFGNGRAIMRLMPEAKIIYLHRNPFHVLASSHRVGVKALQQPHPYLSALSDSYLSLTQSGFPWRVMRHVARDGSDMLAGLVIHHTAMTVRRYLDGLPLQGDDHRIDVRYEDLCRRPNEEMARILRYLGVTGQKRDYGTMIETATSDVVPAIARRRDLILKKFSPYARTVGFDIARYAQSL